MSKRWEKARVTSKDRTRARLPREPKPRERARKASRRRSARVHPMIAKRWAENDRMCDVIQARTGRNLNGYMTPVIASWYLAALGRVQS